jgi:hypothetical protein
MERIEVITRQSIDWLHGYRIDADVDGEGRGDHEVVRR